MFITVGIVSVVYALFTMALTANMPREAFFHLSQVSPITQVLFAEKVLGRVGLVWMVLICLACSFGTFNAGLLSVSRFFYATAREHALPPVFSRISMRFMTPWVAIIAVFTVGYASSLAILYTRKYLVVMDMAAVYECIIYVLSAAALVVLRKKMADAPRAFKVPFGLVIPVVTILVFAILAAVTIVTDPAIGYWIIGGLAVILLYVLLVVPRIKEKYKVKRTPRLRKSLAAEGKAGPVSGSVPAMEESGDKT
jgi:amino acid transporter